MVGYKTPRYLRFGWCGARLDDLMNYVPARLTWLTISFVAALLPSYSATQGMDRRASAARMFSDPIPGGAKRPSPERCRRRIVGPIYLKGEMVTDLWIGAPSDPPLETSGDVARAMWMAVITGLCLTGVAAAAIHSLQQF